MASTIISRHADRPDHAERPERPDGRGVRRPGHRRRRPARLGRVLIVAAAVALTLGVGSIVDADTPSPAAKRTCEAAWVRPVEALVTDPFRPPDRRFGPGNRGIEYGTAVGDPVVAVDAGVVVFAGPVGGRPVVVIEHGADLRSTYTSLVAGLVRRGDLVEAGQPVARAGVGFHLGARHDGAYLDPATFIERRCVVLRLVA